LTDSTLKHTDIASHGSRRWREILRYKELYLLSIPGLVFLITFRYIPMYGALIAFKDYNLYAGFFDSPWVGFRFFRELFVYSDFPRVFRNTILISFYKLFFRVPAPIILALLLNEVRNSLFKRSVQTITYIPHFISWVIISGFFMDILSPNAGIVNEVLGVFGIEPIFFMGDKNWFRSVLVITDIWKDAGFGAIIYLAAISGIDPQLYEAAIIDGASRWKQTVYITLPGIASTIIVILILRMGHILEVGHEQVLMMYNPAVYEVGDVITTYIYRVGLGRMEFSLTAAAGLFRSLIACVLIIITNNLAKRMQQASVW
jgi:putative aldouronate transport system permease protein